MPGSSNRFPYARLATWLAQEVGSEQADEEVLSYALEVVVLNAVGLALSLLLAVLLDVLGPAMVVLGTGVVLRKALGGAHLGGPVRCLTFSALVVVSLGELSLIMARSFDTAALLVATAGAGCFLFIASHLWAPADTAAKPILSPVYRRKLRVWGYIVTLLVTGVAAVLVLLAAFRPGLRVPAAAVILVSFWQGVILSPGGFALLGWVDRVVDFLIKEVR